MPSGYLRAPDAAIQPGDIYSNVPFLFPLPEPEIVRVVDDGHYERLREDAVDLRERELALCERRIVIAMLHPDTPTCEIDKLIPPNGKPPKANEESVLAFFECIKAEQLGPLWREKLKYPERFKRLLPLPEKLTLPGEASTVNAAVQFRRLQQFSNVDVVQFTRVASLTENGLRAVRFAYSLFLDREQPQPIVARVTKFCASRVQRLFRR